MKRVLVFCCVLMLVGLSGCSITESGQWEWGIRSGNAKVQAERFTLAIDPYDFETEGGGLFGSPEEGYRGLLLKVENTSHRPFVLDRSQCFFVQEGSLNGRLLFDGEGDASVYAELPPVKIYPGETFAKPVHPVKLLQDGKPGFLPLGDVGVFVTVREGLDTETAEATLNFQRYWVEN